MKQGWVTLAVGCLVAFVGAGGGVAWSLHDTVTNGNSMFGHWLPAVVTAVVGAVLGFGIGAPVGCLRAIFQRPK